jgi:acetyl esterase/lipase
MPSLKSMLVRELFRFNMLRNRGGSEMDIARVRQQLDALAERGKPPQGITTEQVQVGDVPGMWITPVDARPKAVMLYLHGGAYIAGSFKSHLGMVANFAKTAKIRTLMVEYRLAPEHPFPAALDDAVTAFCWLIDNNVDPKHIVIAGDSAGGGLTLATLIKLRDEGQALPGAAVCLSPWTDLAGTGDSLKSRAWLDPWLDAKSVVPTGALYHGGKYPADHPLVSPLYADLKGLPPILIHVGGWEILYNDATRMVDKLRAAGGKVEFEAWPGMWHVFQALGSMLPESRDSVDKVATFIQAHV